MVALWHINSTTSDLLSEKPANSNLKQYKSVCSMISTGTERLVASGLVDDSFHEKMKVPYQSGNFDLPIKYGYSLIIEGENGKLGHIMHPHQDIVEVEEEDVFWIDSDIPPERLALISNMETVLNAIWDARIIGNEKVAICGFGNVGALLANTLRVYKGIDAEIIEINSWRQEKIRELGWNLHDGKEHFDIIFNTSTSEEGLQYCLDHLNYEGRLIELSWFGNKKVNLELGKSFHYNRIQIIGSQVSQIPGHMKHQYDYLSRKGLALKIIEDPSFDRLIADTIPFEKSPQFFDQLRNEEVSDGIIHILEY